MIRTKKELRLIKSDEDKLVLNDKTRKSEVFLSNQLNLVSGVFIY